jgi:DNA replication and repair protein RecF
MAPQVRIIVEERRKVCESLAPIASELYSILTSGKPEPIEIQYVPSFSEGSITEIWKAKAAADIVASRTLIGPHRDDMEFRISGQLLKRFGSQGQQKSFVLALKLAQSHYLKTQLNRNPILLLDDVFDKLDEDRIRQIEPVISQVGPNQVFITDAREERTRLLFKPEDTLIRLES